MIRRLALLIPLFAGAFLGPMQAGSAASIDAEILASAKLANISALSEPTASSAEVRALGRSLFYDPLLSGNRNISCASCHDPALGSGDGKPLSFGEGGELLPRNTPPLYNLGQPQIRRLFWDGRVSLKSSGFLTPELGLNGPAPVLKDVTAALGSALAAQTLFPMVSHAEMRGAPGTNEIADAPTNAAAWERIALRVTGSEKYAPLLASAYPQAALEKINIGHLAHALAAHISAAFDSRRTNWDRYLAGDMDALSEREKQGARVFLSEKARCVRCHNGPLLSDLELHNTAFPQIGPGVALNHDDYGGFSVKPVSQGVMFSFRTPPLRNVALTAPYTHSGAILSLRDVVVHYTGQAKSLSTYQVDPIQALYQVPILHSTQNDSLRLSFLSQDISLPPIELSPEEIDDLVFFLEQSLTDRSLGAEAP